MSQVIGLFPTPFLRVPTIVGRPLLQATLQEALSSVRQHNDKSDLLSHTAAVTPRSSENLVAICQLVLPSVVEFGTLLFGESLRWGIKEMWINVLETGGHQALHNHANSFISGVIFLTKPHPTTHTVFHKAMGTPEFSFANNNQAVQTGPFNATKWVMPEAEAGDLILFPSYMLHAVPRNEGEQRVSVAFNAIPDHLDSWGYAIRFA
jgi:hypothetical protein